MKKLVMLCSLLLLFAFSSWAQVTVTVGTGTSTGRYPLDDYFVYSQSQCLYLASEIGMGGTITKLRWYRDDTGADPNAIGTTEIWLMETANTTLTGTAWEGPGTLVATISNIDLGSGGGWYEVDITDFVYSGAQNLLVSVYTQDAPYTSPHTYWRYTTATDMARLGNSDTENPPTMSISGNRPNIQFDIFPTIPYFTLTPSSLGFGFVSYPGSSAEYTYTISGDNLTAGPVVITAPAGFGVSLTTGGPYTSSVNVSYTPPTLALTTIYSNFSPLAASTLYSGNITNVGGGTSGNVAVSGTSELIYCTPTYVNGGTGDYISQVTLNTLSQATASNLTPYYIDYTTTQNAIPDISAGTTAQLSLTFSSDGNQYNGVWIDFNLNGLFDVTEFFSSNTNAGSNGTVTIDIAVPVSATLGQTRMRIRGGDDNQPSSTQACGASSSTWGQAQDYLVNITAPPACLPPSALTATNITNTSAVLGWTENGTATLWNIELGAPGFTPGTGTSLTGVTGTSSNPWTAIGGSPNTTYEFYVQANCGGSQSTWSGPYSLTTLCDPIATLPYTEGFEGATFPPDCWTNSGWVQSLYGASHTGTEWAYSNLAGSMLTSPSFVLTSNSRLRYWYRVESATYPQDMDVLLSTDGINFTTTLANYVGIVNNTYTEAVIDLSAYTGQTVTIRFNGLTGAGGFDYGVLVDDFTMEEIVVPVITSLGSTSGCVGSDLIINGTNLDGATSVTIGGSAATITDNTPTSITVTVGTGTTGTVAVTTLSGTVTSTETFTVNPLPLLYTVSGGGTYCAGATGVTITVDGSESGVNYDLSTTPVTTLSGTGSALTFGPAAFGTGIYTVMATNATTTCALAMTGNASVTENPSPTAVSATASSNLICAGTSIDLFSSAISGSTVPNTLLTESFENAGAIPAGWGEDLDVDGNATNAALTYETASANPTGFIAFDGTYFVRFNSFTVNNGNSARLRQTTSFSTVGYTGIAVNFAWTQDDQYTTSNDNVVVEYSTDGITWTTAGTPITRVGTADVWTTQSVILPVAAENQGTLYVAFLFTSAYGNDCHLDNVIITGQSPAPATFAWTSLPAGFTSADQNPVGVLPTETTEYIVTAQNSYSCTTSASTVVTVDPCTSIKENNDGISVSVVPNPSNGMFYVNVNGINETVTLNIYSINGQVVYTEQVDNTGLINKPIDLKSYPKGMYFLRLINNNITHTEKIIIE